MKVYTCGDIYSDGPPPLNEVGVARETEHLLFFDRPKELGYRAQAYKHDAGVWFFYTPREAILKFTDRARNSIEYKERELSVLRAQLDAATLMLLKYPEEGP